MKSCFIYFVFLAVFSVCLGQQPSTNTALSSDSAKLDAVTNRIRSGDYSAFSEVAQMPAPVAIPYLYNWTSQGVANNGPLNQAAIQAFRQVQGSVVYLQQNSAQVDVNRGFAAYYFQSLAIIGTQEAQSAVAPYLFDSKMVPPVVQGDDQQIVICIQAMGAFAEMRLPDNPVKSEHMSDSDALVAWQKWAIAKGLVPKDWISRVGAPALLLELEGYAPPSSSQSTPSKSALANSPVPTAHEAGHLSDTPSTNESKVNNVKSAYSWLLLISALGIAIIGIIGYLILRRKK